MCRWLAYMGGSVPIKRALFDTEHSLIDQSIHSLEGVEPTNGDGFGLGWYTDHTPEPGLYRSIEPAWNDENLLELATHISSPLFFAHVRATTGTAVQESNCHPFRHGRWMFMHNGSIAGIDLIRRDIAFAIDPSLFNEIRGTTDSELLFLLAITEGMLDDPFPALERAVGRIEAFAEQRGVPTPVQMTIALADGAQMWSARYASSGTPRSLYVSEDVTALRALHPGAAVLDELTDDARLVVSEPLGSLPGAWRPVTDSTAIHVSTGGLELRAFEPKRPALSVSMA